MSNLFIENDVNYQFITTGDDSPSLSVWSEKHPPEAMHHSGGALSESLYIYHSALVEALDRHLAPHILSLGLGCGYNEMITVGHLLASQSNFSDFYLESFESSELLRTAFQEWIGRNPPQSPVKIALNKMHENISQMVANKFAISAEILKSKLGELLALEQLVLRPAIDETTQFQRPFSLIFFDAFCGKSSPELWSENFLAHFLKAAAAPHSLLTTYAATGALNRALRSQGFTLSDQPGFQGKRQSTRALRFTV